MLVVAVVLAFAVPCLVQTAQPPKPGPEVQKLAYYVGTWKSEGELKIGGPFGPAGKFSGTDTGSPEAQGHPRGGPASCR